jgi:hypothetical protein
MNPITDFISERFFSLLHSKTDYEWKIAVNASRRFIFNLSAQQNVGKEVRVETEINRTPHRPTTTTYSSSLTMMKTAKFSTCL